MKKFISIICTLMIGIFNMFGDENKLLDKRSKTLDECWIKLYQIDKSEYSDSFEYYVSILVSDDECFTWCFDKLKDAMEHYKWLEERKIKNRIPYWRKFSENCNIDDDIDIINYWIVPDWDTDIWR